ncbi:hypothetical protein EVAR_17705_1 [Eumeta japonica]|uniref:Uncharacterized protein n=1 Tax=Eumeta variegata TaxID=151549 RepID=A0A4C1UT07_EUMVA|nr:hypothetical protein EVAR_17705_1 [Eumeta japonica]
MRTALTKVPCGSLDSVASTCDAPWRCDVQFGKPWYSSDFDLDLTSSYNPNLGPHSDSGFIFDSNLDPLLSSDRDSILCFDLVLASDFDLSPVFICGF